MSKRRVQEIPHFSEGNYFIEPFVELLFRKAVHTANQIYVLTRSKLTYKSTSELNHWSDFAVYGHGPFIRKQNSSNQLQESTFSLAVGSYEAYSFPGRDVKAHVSNCPKIALGSS